MFSTAQGQWQAYAAPGDLDPPYVNNPGQVTGTIDIQALEPLGVVRETGRIAIGCSNHFRVRVDNTNRVDQIDRMGLDLPQEAADGCALLSAYRYTSRLWTVLLPSEYKVSLVKRESNLEKVAAAYQQEERKLSFLDELRQMMQVAGTKGRSAARSNAQDNLEQAGQALHDYAQQSAQVDASNAAERQEQAQQIEAAIQRLEESKPDTTRADGDTTRYFRQTRPGPESSRVDVEPVRGFDKLSDLDMGGDGKAKPGDGGKELQDPVGGRPDERRGKLREQAAEQLEKLQTMQQEEHTQLKPAVPQPPSQLPAGEEEDGPVGSRFAFDRRAGEQVAQDGQAAPGDPTAKAGYLSLDLDLTLVGSAYHFRKLHGEPRLVLSARHENLTRFLSALVWAGLCLGLAIAAIAVLRRPNAVALAYHYWPHLAAVAGAAWLFLLPAGVAGLALLVTALCVLIARLRKRQTTGTGVSNVERGTA